MLVDRCINYRFYVPCRVNETWNSCKNMNIINYSTPVLKVRHHASCTCGIIRVVPSRAFCDSEL
jgi:hypothetical protein